MMSKTPMRDSKRTVRRKLASPKASFRPVSPLTKKARVENGEDGVESPKSHLIDSTPPPNLRDSDEFCSQEVGSQMNGGLPRIIWQVQQINSPLVSESDDARDSELFSDVRIDSPKPRGANAASTPYLNKIWNGSKARLQASASADCSGSRSAAAKKKSHGTWINEMYCLVSKLEEHNSRSPTPDQSETTPSQYTAVVSRKGGTALPPSSDMTHTDNSQSKDADKTSCQAAAGGPRSQSHIRPDTNSSLFSDSMDDFIGEFSDIDEDKSACVAKAKSSTDVSHNNEPCLPAVVATHGKLADPSSRPSTNSKSVAFKTESSLPVKVEPSSAFTAFKHKGSPGTPLRRYSSHDSVVKSPQPSLPPSTVTGPSSSAAVNTAAPATQSVMTPAPPSTTEKSTHDLIEEKRKLALSKLKNRKGSFVRHRSLDSATNGPRGSQSQPVASQSAITDVPTKTLEQIIEEKRKSAAERLQRRRGERDRSESLSGSRRQITPPSSQERESGSTAMTKQAADSQLTPTKVKQQGANSQHTPTKGNVESKVVEQSRSVSPSQPVAVKQEVPAAVKQEVISQTSVPGSQSSSTFSGKIAIDSLIEDLERNSPRKPKPPPARHNKMAINDKRREETVVKGSVVTKLTQSNSLPSKEGLDERTRFIIEEKRRAALEKLKQSKQHKT